MDYTIFCQLVYSLHGCVCVAVVFILKYIKIIFFIFKKLFFDINILK